ncbi:unnamed protein product [Acanthoscelides obtectus]|uniref:DDE-1 domain-containing protein n=1 Tax=Acanthoscelides obtectus TaxID=200917 RepID=A0A9P0P9N7_ACAOB|nr:unnamed protein product [Acanthoscelides obtectus]CAK1680025.1 hypothetical protein AOBTE_LOCUS32495 [Acanthoscelides obtectus]
MARENGVIILQLPGHTTHCLQPLDVAVFKPFQVYYDQSVEKWLREHPGRTIGQFQVARLIGEGYGKGACVANAISGFKKCGIWPVDRNVFTDVDFEGGDVLQTEPKQKALAESKGADDTPSSDDDVPLALLVEKQKSCATSESQAPDVSFEDILPIANSPGNQKNASKRAQAAKVITSTPHNDELKLKQSTIEEKKKRLAKRKIGIANGQPEKKVKMLRMVQMT